MDRKIRKELIDNLAVSVSITARALGTGEYACYSGIKSGDIPAIKVGNRLRVPTAWLRRKLDIEPQARKPDGVEAA
jgi:hypothetical protein